jgi:hypothetical protein
MKIAVSTTSQHQITADIWHATVVEAHDVTIDDMILHAKVDRRVRGSRSRSSRREIATVYWICLQRILQLEK